MDAEATSERLDDIPRRADEITPRRARAARADPAAQSETPSEIEIESETTRRRPTAAGDRRRRSPRLGWSKTRRTNEPKRKGIKGANIMQTLFDLDSATVDAPTPAKIMQGRTGRAASYAAKLTWVLGDGREWEYRGECWELPRATGECACGHKGLIFQFRIHHTKSDRTAIVGSSCIETYEGITPELVTRLTTDLDRLQNAARLRITQAKNAARAERVQLLLAELSALEWNCDAACAAWRSRNPRERYEPYDIYKRGNYERRLEQREERTAAGLLHHCAKIPGLKTTTGQVKRLEGAIADAKRELERILEASR